MIGVLPTSEGMVEVNRPDELLKTFMVFIQDRGTGSKFLREGSQLLIHLEVRPEPNTLYMYLF